MTTAIRPIGRAPRQSAERKPTANWRNREWQYQGAATHSDSTAFRARQIARGLKVREGA